MAAAQRIASTSARTIGHSGYGFSNVAPAQLRRFSATPSSSAPPPPSPRPGVSDADDEPLSPEVQATRPESIAERHRIRSSLSHLSDLGSSQTRKTAWNPNHARTRPPSAREVTLSHLLAATAQVGHNIATMNRAYQPWIYGHRHGIAQIDVEKATLPALRRASRVVKDIVANDGVVLIVGTERQVARAVITAAKRMGPNGYHVTTNRWMSGVLTNSGKQLAKAVLQDVDDYVEQYLEIHGTTDQADRDFLAARRAEEQAERKRRQGEVDEEGGPDGSSGGSSGSTPKVSAEQASGPNATAFASKYLKPDVVIVLSPKTNYNAIKEATLCNIPTIGIIDTDVDPRLVTYPIPANDESLRVQELVVGVLSKAGEEGWREREQKWAQWNAKVEREEIRTEKEQREYDAEKAARADLEERMEGETEKSQGIDSRRR
ncbi:unnamed protein product [Jaminaea pallidilutea]